MKKILLALACVFACFSQVSFAADGQTFNGWECQPYGQPHEPSAQKIQIRADGSIGNTSETSSIRVVCPLRTKKTSAYISTTEVHYVDNHPSKTVNCRMYVETDEGLKSYYKASGTGYVTYWLGLYNQSKQGDQAWLSCYIPPAYDGKVSTIQHYEATFSTDLDCAMTMLGICILYDTNWIKMPGNSARLSGPLVTGKPFTHGSSSAIANLSYEESLPVVFPLYRDDMSVDGVTAVFVNAENYSGDISPASCQVIHSFPDGVQSTQTVDMSWIDKGPSSGYYYAHINEAVVSPNSIYSVQCQIPPRTGTRAPRITWVNYHY
jgi:hypothetical protein